MVKYESVDTVIDRFLDYVKANGKTTLSSVSSALGIAPSQAERLAFLLEQSGFIEVQYGLADIVVSVAKKQDKKEVLASESSKIILESQELEREVLAAENLTKFFEKDILRRIVLAERLLGEMQENPEFTFVEVQAVEREVDLALGQLAAFSQEVKSLADKEEDFYNKLISFKHKLHVLKASRKVEKQITFMQRVIEWVKNLLREWTLKRRRVRVAPRKKKHYDKLHGVTFVGKGEAVRRRVFKQRYLKRREAAK